ncbi:MAG: PEGA domain-containing protein [Bacteroidetes bacterium]|nr:PEGA domain-containing protein [Bacteroidota bacterium]
MKTKHKVLYGIFLVVFSFSCASTTTISSTTPGAEVYIGGEYKGTTPYRHSDYLPTGFGRKVTIKKEGYKPVETKIRKLGRVNPMAVYGILWGGLPVLWAGGYKRFYEYELVPENGGAAVRSDYLTFGESFSTSNRALPVYVGNSNGFYYVYAAGFLHALNTDLSLNHSVKLDKESGSIPIDGYFLGDDKRIVEFFPVDNSVKITTVDPSNKLSEYTIKDVRYIDEIFSEDYCYGYKRCDVTNNFICYSEKSITAFDADLNKLYSYQSEKKILESYLLADDRILSLELQSNNLFLCLREGGEESYYEIDTDKNYDSRSFRLNINEEVGKCHVSSLIGSTDSKKNFTPVGVRVLTYGLTDISLADSGNVMFNEDIKDCRRQYFINKGVVSDQENVFIQLEEQWIISSTESAAYVTGNIVVINTEKEGAPQQKISKYVASSIHQDKLSFQSQLKNGQLYYVFNTTVGSRQLVNQVVLDENLEMISWGLYDTYKEEKTIFHGLKGYEMEDGRYFYFHQYKTKLGAIISDF